MADEVEAGSSGPPRSARWPGGWHRSRAWILPTPTAWAADGTPAGATMGASPATGRVPGSRSARAHTAETGHPARVYGGREQVTVHWVQGGRTVR
jgi:hypothetical protein